MSVEWDVKPENNTQIDKRIVLGKEVTIIHDGSYFVYPLYIVLPVLGMYFDKVVMVYKSMNELVVDPGTLVIAWSLVDTVRVRGVNETRDSKVLIISNVLGYNTRGKASLVAHDVVTVMFRKLPRPVAFLSKSDRVAVICVTYNPIGTRIAAKAVRYAMDHELKDVNEVSLHQIDLKFAKELYSQYDIRALGYANVYQEILESIDTGIRIPVKIDSRACRENGIDIEIEDDVIQLTRHVDVTSSEIFDGDDMGSLMVCSLEEPIKVVGDLVIKLRILRSRAIIRDVLFRGNVCVGDECFRHPNTDEDGVLCLGTYRMPEELSGVELCSTMKKIVDDLVELVKRPNLASPYYIPRILREIEVECKEMKGW